MSGRSANCARYGSCIASNVILLGPPGVGKTHLAVALAETAIQSGQAAYFMTAHDLVTDLGTGLPGRQAGPGGCASILHPRSSSSMKWAICRWTSWARRFS